MEKGDLDIVRTTRLVVVVHPLVATPPEERPRNFLGAIGRGRNRPDLDPLQWTYNHQMLAWIVQTAVTTSAYIDLWCFLPEPIGSKVLDRIDRLTDYCTADKMQWSSPKEASHYLQHARNIHTVYDADQERSLRWWALRGYVVPEGATP